MRSLVFCLLMFLIGCQQPPARTGNEFHIQIATEPANLDPSLAEDGGAMRILAATMRGLMAYDSQGTLIPALAQSVVPEAKGLRYRVTLQPTARWSDGKPVVAQHFMSGFERTLNPKTAAKLADLLFLIKNAKAYKEGKIADFSAVGIKAVSPSVLLFELEKPAAFFPHLLALTVALPQKGGGFGEGAPVTGPYFIKSWKADELIRLEKNPHSEELAPSSPHVVEFHVVAEETSALNLMQHGRLDLLVKVPYFDLERLRRDGRVRTFPYLATYYIAANQKHNIWASAAHRRVLSSIIKRADIVALLKGDGLVARSWVHPQIKKKSVEFSKVSDAEVSALKLALKKAKPEDLVLQFDGSSRNQMIAEKVQADVLEALGVKLSLRPRDWKTHIREITLDPPGLFRFGWLAPFIDPVALLVPFRSDDPNNYTGWKSKEYDDLVDRIAATPNGPVRDELVERADRLLSDQEAAVIPVFQYQQTVIVSPRVKNININALGHIDFKSLKIE